MASKLFRSTIQAFLSSNKTSHLATFDLVAFKSTTAYKFMSSEKQMGCSTRRNPHILFDARPNNSILNLLRQMSPNYAQQLRLYNLEKKDPVGVPDNRPRPGDPKIIVSDFKEDKEPSAGKKIKLLVRDYGPAAMVVHISLSLVSLGCFYMAIEWGMPIESAIEKISMSGKFNPDAASTVDTQAIAVGGTFVVAYALHKCFMPFRLAATCFITPVLVGFLRRRGILKPHTRPE